MAEKIKYGQSLSTFGLGETIPKLPYGDTNLGGLAFNTSVNIINMAYNRAFGDPIIFGSASKHITRRYVSSILMSKIFGKIQDAPRIKRLKEIQEFQEHIDLRANELRKITQQDNLLKETYRNPNTGAILDSYLKLTVANIPPNENIKKDDIINIVPNQTPPNEVPPYIDGSTIIGTSSKKNVILTAVTARDTSIKEYVSGGDVMISASGSITSRLDKHPIDEIKLFVYYMEYNGVLEAEHIALLPHNIKHILITDYKIDYKAGKMNSVDYSFSAVGVAQNKQTAFTYRISENIQNTTQGVNKWLTSELDKNKEWTNFEIKEGSSSKNKTGVRKFIDKYL